MEYFLLLSIALFIGVSAWTVSYVGKEKHRTISQHVAKSRLTQIVFGAVALLATLLASCVIFADILPHYRSSEIGYGIFGLVMACFLVAAVVPYIKGTRRGQVHDIAAWGVCYLIPIAIFVSLFWPLSDLAWQLSFGLLIAVCLLLLLLATVKSLRRQFLGLQSLYLGLFFVYLVVITYL